MKRDEAIAIATQLRDRGFSPESISPLVGRSERWVRKVAREHPRQYKVQYIVSPPEQPNVAKGVSDAPRRKGRRRARGFWGQVRDTLRLTGAVALLILYVLAMIRDLRGGHAPPKQHMEGGPVP